MDKFKTTLEEYCNKQILIPCYQRGYIWGKDQGRKDKPDSVSYMLDSLYKGYESKHEIFIQGITVIESDLEYTVIDGQQRSTFFYLLLKVLGDTAFSIRYDSSHRSSSNSCGYSPQQWLENVKESTECEENKDEYYQDIYFFKKTLRLIKENPLYKKDRKDVIKYLKEKVCFLLIPINEKIAVSTFTMMNGNKALMQDFELIKADLLRRASMGTGGYNAEASEWDNISLRSRYAHEWDKWLHWWNRQDVQLVYNCENPMGWLLKTVFMNDNNLYDAFRKYIDKSQEGKSEAQKAKLMFARLRSMQKRFEEVFSHPIRHNQFGLIVRLLEKKDVVLFMDAYFNDFNDFNDKATALKDLELVYNLLLFGMTYNEIRDRKNETFTEKKEKLVRTLLQEPIYNRNNELAYKYLLIRNVERDNALNRNFDFTSWIGNRSLEHVYPKSKVVHKHEDYWLNGSDEHVQLLDGLEYDNESNAWINREGKQVEEAYGYILRESIKNEELNRRDVIITEHSIGNLLLLYGKDNSAFGNKMPEEKRVYYFNPQKDILPSRNLLHTVFSFGRFEHFGGIEICKNHLEAIGDIEKRIEKLNRFLHKEEAL